MFSKMELLDQTEAARSARDGATHREQAELGLLRVSVRLGVKLRVRVRVRVLCQSSSAMWLALSSSK